MYARFAPPTVNDKWLVSDCISSLRDLWDSEEFKINSDISSSLKATVDKICREGNEMFEQCFEEVKEGLEKARTNNLGAFFPSYVYILGPRTAKSPRKAA